MAMAMVTYHKYKDHTVVDTSRRSTPANLSNSEERFWQFWHISEQASARSVNKGDTTVLHSTATFITVQYGHFTHIQI
eukprot:scaffold10186_cov33-Attheya_sp.AAC.2